MLSRIELPVYVEDIEEGSMPADIPFLREDGDLSWWDVSVRLSDGQIHDWPGGGSHEIFLKVVDGGRYSLLDEDLGELARLPIRKQPYRL